MGCCQWFCSQTDLSNTVPVTVSIVGLVDLKDLFQPKHFYDSMQGQHSFVTILLL